jgi:hypothetical protein
MGRSSVRSFPQRLFKRFRDYTSLLIIIFVTALVYISISSLIPEQIGYTWTRDANKAGYYNTPGGFGAFIGGAILGGLIYKMKHVQWQLMVGVALQTIFTSLQAFITPHRIGMGMVFQFIANTTFGWILINYYVTCSLHIPQRDIGLAYGLIGSSRFLGGAVGTAIFFTVLANEAARAIPSRVLTALTPMNYPVSEIPSLISTISSGTPAQLASIPPAVLSATTNAIRWGYTDVFKVTWFVSIPFGVVAFVVSIFVIDPLPYFTNIRLSRLRKNGWAERGWTLGAASRRRSRAVSMGRRHKYN